MPDNPDPARPAAAIVADIKARIRTIPDWPKPGVQFRDVTTLWNSPEGFRLSVDAFADYYGQFDFSTIVGIESRGFIIGAALAARLEKGFVPIRKRGKLPAEVESHEYELEYGSDCIEIHRDAIIGGQKVLLMDDLLATGGTMRAACHLLSKLGGTVLSCGVIVDLPALAGRKLLEADGFHVFSLVEFDGG